MSIGGAPAKDALTEEACPAILNARSEHAPVGQGLPLAIVATGATLVLILFTAGAVGLSGFQGARDSVEELWPNLADNIAQRTTSETLRLIGQAEPYAAASGALIASGVLEVDDPDQQLFPYLTESATSWPQFTWVYYGQEALGHVPWRPPSGRRSGAGTSPSQPRT